MLHYVGPVIASETHAADAGAHQTNNTAELSGLEEGLRLLFATRTDSKRRRYLHLF